MKLQEALNILNKNNYLVEFLQDTKIPVDKVVKRLEKEFNIKIYNDTSEIDRYMKLCQDVKQKLYYDEDEANHLKSRSNNIFITDDIDYSKLTQDDIDRIEEIGRIFNVNIHVSTRNTYRKKQSGTQFSIYSVSSKNPNLKYKPYFDSNLFIHSCYVKPDIIMRTGLRTKKDAKKHDEYGINYGWGGVEKDGERRIYMSSIARNDKLKNKPIETIAKYLYYGMDNLYGLYHYLIKLPKNYPIRRDPEGEDDMDWVYTVQAIPPQFILYLGYGGTDLENDGNEIPLEPAVTEQEILNFIRK